MMDDAQQWGFNFVKYKREGLLSLEKIFLSAY
jgi:hypothetical protein